MTLLIDKVLEFLVNWFCVGIAIELVVVLVNMLTVVLVVVVVVIVVLLTKVVLVLLLLLLLLLFAAFSIIFDNGSWGRGSRGGCSAGGR